VKRRALQLPATGSGSLREPPLRLASRPPTALQIARRGPGREVSEGPATAGRDASPGSPRLFHARTQARRGRRMGIHRRPKGSASV